MKVAKITLWDGREFYTGDWTHDALSRFRDNVRSEAGDQMPKDATMHVDMIEMTDEEYAAIPTSTEAHRLFSLLVQG
jgi:hypothetical protein